MFCRQCGTNLLEGSRFCASCGAQQVAAAAPAPPAPPTPGICTGCGVTLTPGRRFCTSCGTPVGGTAVAAPYAAAPQVPPYAAPPPQYAAPPPAAPYAPSYPPAAPPNGLAGPYAGYAAVPGQKQPIADVVKSLSPLSLGVLGGFAAAALSTFFSWITVAGFSASGWKDNVRFQLADWLSMDFPLDAIVVVLIAAGGALMLVGPRMGLSLPRIPRATLIAGVALAVLGILEFWYIRRAADDVPSGDFKLSTGFGIYLLIAGGAAAAICTYLEERKAATG